MKINFFIQSFFIAKSHVGNQIKKASVLLLSKEATSKDQQLKTQMKNGDRVAGKCVF